MKNIWQWLRALLHWFFELRHLWLACLITTVSLVVSLHHGTSESVIRLTGLGLQLLGIGTVIWGIRETKSLFGKPSGWSILSVWLRRVPRYGPRIIAASGSITLGDMKVSASGYSTHSAGDNPTLEARIAALEKNIHAVNARIDYAQNETAAQFRNMSATLKQEEATRAAADQKFNDKLEATGTGGLYISAIGSLWLLVGVTLSTASVELSHWLR